MNILVIGSGAREHALAWKLRRSPLLNDLFVAPGNPGTAAIAQNLPVQPMDFEGILRTAREHRAELVVVGPEDPLAAGIVDFLAEHGVAAFGPSQAAARIEASKSFAKSVMRRAAIPTAESASFDDPALALRWAEVWTDRTGTPPVVKADGLAAGKGVTVAADLDGARQAIRSAIADGALGAAGRRIVLEERMFGPETSAHAFCDGTIARPMAYSCDAKRIFDGDRGPNTGGMGAYSPPGFVDPALADQIERTVIAPAVRTMSELGAPYRGTLYPGLMLTDAGPRVIEFNCRFGDPETQVLMPRLESDLLPILLACIHGGLAEVEITWSDDATVGVVLASGGYPGPHETDLSILGLDDLGPDVQVFHAGTRLADGRLLTAGGRVLTVVARGSDLASARRRVYDSVSRIHFDGMHYRKDIALRELES